MLPGDDETFQRLVLTETLFLFVARLAFEEGVAARQTQDGLVHLCGDALLERYLALTHRDAPKKGDFVDLLKRFKRHGLLRFGEEDAASGLPRLALLPALRQVAGDRCLERLEAHVVKTARDEEPDAISEDVP